MLPLCWRDRGVCSESGLLIVDFSDLWYGNLSTHALLRMNLWVVCITDISQWIAKVCTVFNYVLETRALCERLIIPVFWILFPGSCWCQKFVWDSCWKVQASCWSTNRFLQAVPCLGGGESWRLWSIWQFWWRPSRRTFADSRWGDCTDFLRRINRA